MQLPVRWAQTASERGEAAVFLASVLELDPSYISHGEVQEGLSTDGVSWSSAMPRRMAEDLAPDREDRSVALVRDEQGEIIGSAIVVWVSGPPVRFAVIEDLAVSPARRGQGLGARIMGFIQEEAGRRGMQWLFLESGLRNVQAHRLFEREGYEVLSYTFAKPLG